LRVNSAVVPVDATDQGKTLLVGVPAGAARIEVKYTVRLRESGRESIGYYLFESAREAEHWYPKPKEARFADFEVTISRPAAWTMLTSGAGSSEDAGAGTVRERLRAEHVEGFALAIGEHYRLQTLEEDGIRAVAFSSPEQMETFRSIARHALNAAAGYKSMYGFFPVAQIGIVPGYRGAAGGYPLPNAFMIHQGILDDEFIAAITAHELAHYYWGLYVLDAGERLGWLMLANGIWADQMYLARRKGIPLLEQWRDTAITPAGALNFLVDYTTAIAGGYDQRLGITRAEEDGMPYDYNSYVRHGKGATGVMLQALRIGGERFAEVQRGLLRDFRYKTLAVDEFARRLEAAGATGASDFFAAWQRGDGRIDYAISDVNPRDNKVAVTVVRRGTVAYPVTVELEDSGGKKMRRTLRGDDREVVEFESATIRSVLLDPDGVLPMWNSGHPQMRRALLKGLIAAGLSTPFTELATAYLAAHPGASDIRYLLAQDLFRRGAFAEAANMAEVTGLTTANQCRIALLRARAQWRGGRHQEARNALGEIEKSAACGVIGASVARLRREIE
jgi:hypothetical protein